MSTSAKRNTLSSGDVTQRLQARRSTKGPLSNRAVSLIHRRETDENANDENSSLERLDLSTERKFTEELPGCTSSANDAVVRQLSREVRKLEQTGRPVELTPISTGCEALDACLPQQGYTPGSVIEYLRTSPACGASYLAYTAAAAAMKAGVGYLVIVDTQHTIYPPALRSHGIDLKRVVFVRPESHADAIWSVDQALRTPAVAAVVSDLEKIDDRAARRLQLAAEAGSGIALLLRSASARRKPSWAEVQWLVRSPTEMMLRREQARQNKRTKNSPLELPPVTTTGRASAEAEKGSSADVPATDLADGSEHRSVPQVPPELLFRRRLQVKLIRNRGGRPGAIVHLEVDGVTGELRPVLRERNRHEKQAAVRLASELASPKSPSRRAAAG